MLIDEAGRRLGLSSTRLYVPDLQQVHLIALPYPARQDTPALDIDDSTAGLAYRTQRIQRTRDGGTAWLPLIDGIERLGVMMITAPELDPHLLESCTALAGLTALLVASKATYSDLLVARERSRAMTIQAELLWSYLPPRAIGTDQVTSSAALEPAYDIGGDAFDHNLTENVLHLALLDAMGHDLASGGSSAAALAACRATRRDGGTLADIATTIDRTLDLWIPGRLLTAVIANLDIASGWLTWINCGHPPPLLIRDDAVLPLALERTPQPPLALGFHSVTPPTQHRIRLQPGDRVLLYTDGVTEARAPDGDLFGEERLADTVIRSMAAGHNAAEALRSLVDHLLHYQQGQRRDDATVMLTEWHP
ncbi:serine/threonine-protein phosphatase [Streptomyces bobili]|uniref:PP2C family protein-serine/threonine phosphatase n=1 Tax=Streptomyces bobili TaxID=67280 RepID=UPI002252A70A|nr:PP2C family protein-serine/threonine phosphatase [Streptomyces bobili]MCX5528552.1 serine/threonine-protein phosphatase [Streptomyces bobili]